jgi:hypothetical protein
VIRCCARRQVAEHFLSDQKEISVSETIELDQNNRQIVKGIVKASSVTCSVTSAADVYVHVITKDDTAELYKGDGTVIPKLTRTRFYVFRKNPGNAPFSATVDRREILGFWRSAVEVANQKTTLIAATSAGFGGMQQVSGLAIVPTWIWWMAAVGLLFLSAVLLQRQLFRDRERLKISKPTHDLASLIAKICGTDDPAALGSSTALSHAAIEIREKASLGILSVWGRRNAKASNLSFYPLESIPPSHWSSSYINFLDYLKDPKCATQNARHPGSREQYSDLHFDLEEISVLWKLN